MSSDSPPRKLQRVGLLVCLLAIVLMFGSCVPIGNAVYREFNKALTASYDIRPGDAFRSDLISVGPGGLVELALDIDFHTASIQESEDDFGDLEYQARFHFPVEYELTDAGGSRLHQERTVLSWSSGVSLSDQNLDVSGGTASLHKSLKILDRPDSGQLQVAVTVLPDEKYGAQAQSISVEVYENAVNWMRSALIGLVMFVLGIPMLVLGMVLAFAGAAVGTTQVEGAQISTASKQMACACHLGGLAGYVVPFGSIIAPLVLWLSQRESDPFVDDQGREAVNFQISIMLYFIVSLVLMLLLIGFVLIFVVMFMHIVLMIVAALRAYNGEPYRYPLNIRFIR